MPEINFKNIISRGGSQTKAFEELCAQLARQTLNADVAFERYNGDGGDGGVECVVRVEEKVIKGWQAKFVNNVDDLITQASSSLATAVKIHSTLKKYVVCFPFDLTGTTGRLTKRGTPAMSSNDKIKAWINRTLNSYNSQGFVLEEIELWQATKLVELLLLHDTSGGIRTYFFSDTIISENWFRRNIASSIKKAGPRYSPELSVETDIWKSFAAFGQTDDWNCVILKQIDNVRKQLMEFESNIDKQHTDDVFPGLPKEHSAAAAAIYGKAQELLQIIAVTLSSTTLKSVEEKLKEVIESLVQLEQSLVADLNDRYKNENWDNKRWRAFMREYMVSFPAASLDCTRDTLLSLRSFLSFIQSPNFKLTSAKVFLLTGIGGSGKTHCICDVATQRMNNGLLSCLISGDQFSGSPDEWTRFGEALGFNNINSDQLLDALNAAAQQSRKPLIIFFDAVNETMPRSYWGDRITAFADEIAKRPFLKLCISCRSSFLSTCLPEPNTFQVVEHTGFKGFEREACNAFFSFHELNPPLIPILQPELSNPLYLKLLCLTLQARGLKDLPSGWTGLLPVIRAFLFEKEKQLCKQYDLSPNGALVVTALTSIIQEITHRVDSSLSRADATTAISAIGLPIATHALLDWLVKADLLIEDGSFDDQQLAFQTYVRPAFERLGDFLLATEIAKQATANGLDAFLTHQKVQEIFKDEMSIGLNASVIAALSVVLPESYRTELPALFRDSSMYSSIAAIATKAMIWRTADSLTNNTRRFVRDALSEDGYLGMDALFAVCINESKVDALWLSWILETTDLASRDAFFAPYLYTRYNENGVVKRLIEAHHDIDLASLRADVAYRWIIALVWLTASPDRRIKDTSTRAAIAILRYHSQLAPDLIDRLIFVNDEEVTERLLVIVYGAQILNPDKGVLTRLASQLVHNYAENHSFFQNALIRDSIRCIAELAQYLHCLTVPLELLDYNQGDLSQTWELQIPDEALIIQWQEERGAKRLAANSCLTDDFNYYSINCLRDWMEGLKKKDIGAWILSDIIQRKGLDNELHSAYDITIVQETGGGRSKPAYAERIGKKYQWNALYRLASLLHDNIVRKRSYSESDPVRPELILHEERKIDPTLTQPYFVAGTKEENWWLGQVPDLSATETVGAEAWLDFNEDIPSVQDIISGKSFKGQNWIPISSHMSFSSSKDGDDYGSPYRILQISLEAFLVRNADLRKIIRKLEKANLNADILPSGGKFMYCYAGEYPWATACNTEPDWYLGVGDTFGNTRVEMHNATNEIVAEWEYDDTLKRNMYLQVPSKKFFECGDLWWNGRDGYCTDQKTVFKDPRFESGGKMAMVADFDDLISRLEKLNYSMIWALKGEKLLVNHNAQRDRKYFSQLCWMSSSGELHSSDRTYFKNYDSKVGTSD